MARRPPLGVWLHGTKVAELTASAPWALRLRYTPEALDLAPVGAPLLSCSLPLDTRRQDASVFASGLLPEGQHRQAMAQLAGVAANDTYGLLARFGRDVAGALIISEHPPDLNPGETIPYTGDSLAEEVDELPGRPLGLHDDSELSIAGLQDKLLLVKLADGSWARPAHGTPSTHILKIDDPRHPGLVEAEAACLRIAHHTGLTTITPDLVDIGDHTCLIVPRFDRTTRSDGTVDRVHQEDLCQALGRDPDAHRGRGKYEAQGGPSLADAARLLDEHATDPVHELQRLLAAATYAIVIGNADAHGKNLALLHPDPTRITLAPLYDTVPTVLWPKLRKTAAMTVNGKHRLDQITATDLAREAEGWSINKAAAERTVKTTCEQIADAVHALDLPSGISDLVTDRLAQLR